MPEPAEHETGSPAYRYDAFISYRHVEPDRRRAKWLHGALETYRVPRELVAKGFPARLERVFRDEDELPANADLSEQITTALRESRFLVVVCSPRTVESRWVNAEIEHFRRLGRHDRILALLIEGDPRSSFPPALTEIRRSIVDSATGLTAEQIEEVEPLAADIRAERSDARAHTLRTHALLRLMACILGCRFDDLRQREQERRTRRARRVGALLAALVLVLASLTAFAFAQRSRAIVGERVAGVERDVAQSVNSFLNDDLLGAIDPELEDPDVKVVDVLDRAALRLDVRLKDKPAVRARVLQTLGQSYLRIGRPEQARPLLDEALRLGDAGGLLSLDDRDRVAGALAECWWRQRDTDAAMGVLRPAVAGRRARLGAAAGDDTLLAELLNGLGGLHKWAGRLDEAGAAYTEALAIRTRVLSATHTDSLITAYNLAGVDEARARAQLFAAHAAKDEAAKARARVSVLAARDRMQGVADVCAGALGGEAPTTLAARCEVAYLTNLSGDYEEGIRLYTGLVPLLVKHLSERHWRTLEASGNLADALRRSGRHAEAAPLLVELLARYRVVRGPAFPDTIAIAAWLADSLEQTGQTDAAAVALEDVFSDLKAAGVDPGRLRAAAVAVAELYARLGRAEAERAWREQVSLFSPDLAQPAR